MKVKDKVRFATWYAEKFDLDSERIGTITKVLSTGCPPRDAFDVEWIRDGDTWTGLYHGHTLQVVS